MFWKQYYFGLNEKYYLLYQILYGISNSYKYSLALDEFTDISQFYNPFDNYENSKIFIINKSF